MRVAEQLCHTWQANAATYVGFTAPIRNWGMSNFKGWSVFHGRAPTQFYIVLSPKLIEVLYWDWRGSTQAASDGVLCMWCTLESFTTAMDRDCASPVLVLICYVHVPRIFDNDYIHDIGMVLHNQIGWLWALGVDKDELIHA